MASKKITNAIKEQIIASVEKCPELYDRGHDDYKDKIILENLWSKIAVDMGIEGEIRCFYCI